MPRTPNMPTRSNPYQGTYRPAGISITKNDLEAGLKGIKIKAPNRKYSTQAYKSALPKVAGSSGGDN